MVSYVEAAEIEDAGHRKAFRRANGSTQTAEATFSHVYVERRGVEPLRCSVRCFPDLRRGLYRLHGDAIHGTNLGALVANNAVVYFIVKPVSPVVRDGKKFMRILYGSDTLTRTEIIGVGDRLMFVSSGCARKMPPRHAQPAP